MANELQINNGNSVKLRQFDKVPVDLLKLIDKINAILMLEPLSEGEVLILAQFIYSEYKDLTLDEIEDSIFKSKSGRLECNPATYKKLDIDYFGRILTAYRIFKRKEYLKKEKAKVFLHIEEPKEDTEYSRRIAYEFIEKVWNEENQMPFIANWIAAYEHMEENNLIKVSNQEKIELREEVFADIRAEVSRLKSMGLSYLTVQAKKDDKSYVKLQSIRKCIHKYYIDGLYRTV